MASTTQITIYPKTDRDSSALHRVLFLLCEGHRGQNSLTFVRKLPGWLGGVCLTCYHYEYSAPRLARFLSRRGVTAKINFTERLWTAEEKTTWHICNAGKGSKK